MAALRVNLKQTLSAIEPDKLGSERLCVEVIDHYHSLGPKEVAYMRAALAECVKTSRKGAVQLSLFD
jgi:hypothetical protein